MKRKLLITTALSILLAFTFVAGGYAASHIKLVINGKTINSDVKVINGSSYVPLRVVADNLNATTQWDGSTQTITINSKNQTTGKRPEETPHNKFTAKIIRVVDGDTMHVNIQGRDVDIRLLMIDTPEDVDPKTPVEPFGLTAANFAKKLLPPGKTVQIETDTTMKGKYGRLLCYLWVDGKMYNEEVLQKDYARVAYVEKPNTKYESEFEALQAKAKAAGLGIWQIPGYVTSHGYDTTIAQKWDNAGRPNFPEMISATGSTSTSKTSSSVQNQPASSSDTSSSSVTITNVDLDGEVVTIHNSSSSDVNLSGWKLVSETGGQVYYFPDYVLKAGADVKVESGRSAQVGAGVLVWSHRYIWNNHGDPAALYDAAGKIVSEVKSELKN